MNPGPRNHSAVNHSVVNHSAVNQSAIHQSTMNQSAVDQNPVNPVLAFARRAALGWLQFWFKEMAPNTQWALFRIGVAAMTLYILFGRNADLDPEIAQVIRANRELGSALDSIAWPFSVFLWGDGESWVWGMHVVAIVAATVLLAGILSPLMAAVSLIFQLSYAHFNPAMVLGVDGLLMLALAYLALVPSARVLGVFARTAPPPEPPPPRQPHQEIEEPHPLDRLAWSGLVMRVLQIHLCLIYFQSGLTKLSTDWLAGAALWHPRWAKLGVPFSLEALQAEPHLTGLITYSLVLFELFYGVLIWVPALRYGLMALAVLVHLSVGIWWGLLPFNLLMLVMNIVFLKTRHMEFLTAGFRFLAWNLWRLRRPSKPPGQRGVSARITGREG